MGIYDQFETDDAAESGEGIVINYGEETGKIRIRRAGGSNRMFGKRYQALTKPHQRQIDAGNLPDEISRELNARLYADTVIIGWEGVKNRSGDPIEFSKDAAYKLLLDLPALMRDIQRVALDEQMFLKRTQQEASGN